MPSLARHTTALLILGCVFIAFLGWKKGTRIAFWGRESRPWKAPFPDEKPHNDLFIPKQYLIQLYPGHSVKDVSIAVGRDVEPYIGQVIDLDGDSSDDVGIMFGIHEAEDDLVAAIRTYQGVKLVERNYKGKIDGSEL